MEKEEQQFVKGFNNGYLLARYEPVLTSQIAKTLQPDNDYLSGFLSGKEEFELEQTKAQVNQLDQLRSRSAERGREQGDS